MLFDNGREIAAPTAPDFDAFTLTELEAAIRRSQEYLLRDQKPEGYWIGELMVDCTLVADMVAFHHWNGSVDEKWQRKAVNHIFSPAIARRRLEHLSRRPGGSQRHHQGLSGAQTGRRSGDRSRACCARGRRR